LFKAHARIFGLFLQRATIRKKYSDKEIAYRISFNESLKPKLISKLCKKIKNYVLSVNTPQE